MSVAGMVVTVVRPLHGRESDHRLRQGPRDLISNTE